MGNINSGFNVANIKTQMEAIQRSYDEIGKALTEDFKSGMVDKVAEYWACQEAVDFWKGVADAVKTLITDVIGQTYENMFKTINSCANTWDMNTGGQGKNWAENEVPIKKYEATLNTDAIKEEIGGDRGINGTQVTTITSTAFDAALTTTKTAISTAKEAIDATGFIDEQKAQMNGVKSGLDDLYQSIDGAIKQLQTQLTDEINNCIKKYGDTATSVAGAYNGGGEGAATPHAMPMS